MILNLAPAKDWPYADAIKKAKDMGARIEMKNVKGVTRCKKYNVVSTPAWMYKPASYLDVHNGIGKLITTLKKCINWQRCLDVLFDIILSF